MFCHWSFNLEAKLILHVLASISGVILMLEKQLEKYLDGNACYKSLLPQSCMCTFLIDPMIVQANQL